MDITNENFDEVLDLLVNPPPNIENIQREQATRPNTPTPISSNQIQISPQISASGETFLPPHLRGTLSYSDILSENIRLRRQIDTLLTLIAQRTPSNRPHRHSRRPFRRSFRRS